MKENLQKMKYVIMLTSDGQWVRPDIHSYKKKIMAWKIVNYNKTILI